MPLELDAITTARFLFFALLVPALFGSPRWALLAWLTMTNLDATASREAVNSNVGWINAFKSLGLPLLYCWRYRSVASEIWSSLPAKVWIVLSFYASMAALWSDYPLAAIKLIGNMVGILLTIVALEKYSKLGHIDASLIRNFTVTTLALGCLQTFAFSVDAFGFDGFDQAARFTSFVGAQQYAALLVALLALALWMRPVTSVQRISLVCCLIFAIAFNGSRTFGLGAICVIVVYIWLSFRRVLVTALLAMATLVFGVMLSINLGLLESDRFAETDSRLVATVNAIASGQDTAHRAGLRNMTFRIAMYTGLLEHLSDSGELSLVFGHGTSNGGNVALTVFPSNYSVDRLDPNRTIHNEWLRVLYEWGIVGLLLCCITVGGILAGCVIAHKRARDAFVPAALLCYLPALALAFSTENVLAGAGNAVTIGFSILASSLYLAIAPKDSVTFAP